MPKFGKKSLENLDTCDIRLKILFNEVIKYVDCTVMEGHRPEEVQTSYYNSGKSKVKWPDSKHNSKPSKAADIAPWRAGIGIPWPDQAKTYLRTKLNREPTPKELETEEQSRWREWYMFVGFVRGIASQLGIPIRCGADWNSNFEIKDQNFHDLPHFELLDQ